MKFLLLPLLFIAFDSVSAADFTGDGMPLKFISSCEADFNGDGKADKALLLEGLNGRELIALIATSTGYNSFVLSKGRPNMFLSCKISSEVKESSAAGGAGKVYKTKGAFIELIKPESSAVAFLWEKNSFKEIWTAD